MTNPQEYIDAIVRDLKSFVAGTGMARAVVGLSGGVDSAVTLALAVQALGAKNVTGIIMPQHGTSNHVSQHLATQLAAQCKVKTETVEIGQIRDAFQHALPWQGTDVADHNIAPRLRMTILYHFARSFDALVLGTSNKSECLLGYGTKWGDFAADVEVIPHLWKTQVYELAALLAIPQEIIDRPPTAELAMGMTDESELGASYDVLDPILQQLEALDFQLPDGADALTKNILARVLANRHKTELPPSMGLVA